MLNTTPIQLSTTTSEETPTQLQTIFTLAATDKPNEYRAQLAVAGRIRNRLDQEGHIELPTKALREAVKAGVFNDLACFVDHSYVPSMRNLFGIWTDPQWSASEKAVTATLRIYDSDTNTPIKQVIDQILADAAQGNAIPDVGTSLSFWAVWKPRDNFDEPLTLASFRHVESCDIVFKPATRSRIKKALSASQGDFYMLTQEQIDQRLAESGLSADVVTQLSAGTYADINALNQAIATAQNAAALAAVEAQGHDEPQQQPAQLATNNQANAWLDAMQQTAVPLILANSNLPQASITRLQNGRYQSPAQLNAAIQAETDYLAALAADETVQLNGRPRRGVTAGDMQTGEEEAASIINWIFGVEGAPTPAYNMRRVDQIYVALSGDVNFTGVFDPTRVQLAASPTTLPNLALDAMNKVIAAQFARLRYYRWYELVAVVQPNDGSLHDMKWITYGGTGDLPQVADGAAYTEGNIGENKESDAFVKRGRYVGITRKMIRNSDIARMRAVPIALATDSVRTRSAQVASIFTANSGVGPTLSDGNPLFHASRNNIATTALGTDTTAWEAASQEIFNHVEVGSSKPIATFAKYNLASSQLYFQALKNFGYGDGSPTTYNPFAVVDRSPEDPRPVVLPVPDFTDTNNWAALADPNIWPVIMMSYSQNPGGSTHPQPELFTVTSELAGLMFTNDTMPIKVRDEYALGVNGGAGVSKRNVA